MFTGLITDIGRVAAVTRNGDTRLEIETAYDTAGIEIGASICHSGVCLTVTDTAVGRYGVSVSAETLSKTTLGGWSVGTEVNLERSLRVGDEIGGHLVYGHVDGLATIVDVRPDGDSLRLELSVPTGLGRYLAAKGSVALDGVSLTVNTVMDNADGNTHFGVNIIPHTRSCTTLHLSKPGRRLNFEADMLARYVARMTAVR